MEFVNLENIVDIYLGITHTPEYVNEGIPFLSVKDISKGKIDFSNCKYISVEEFNSFPKGAKPQKGDILFCRVGTIGKPIIIPDDIPQFGSFVSLGFLRLKTKNWNPQFIKYWMESDLFWKQVKQNTKGASQVNLNTNWLKKFIIPEFSIETQNKIVEELNKITSIINLSQIKINKYDAIVKSQFIEMFGDCDNYDLIGNVLNICRGASPRPISNYITSNEDGVNWIKIGDVDENSLYITSTEEKITKEGAMKSRAVKPGDFILSNSMSFGRPYILGINGCVHDGWLILSDYENTFNPLYLYHAIRDDEVQYQFNGRANGATVRNLNSELVRNTSIKIPSINQQNKFADFVQQIDKSKYFGGICYGIC